MNNKDLINSFTKYLNDKGKSSSTIISYSKDIEQIYLYNPNKLLTHLKKNELEEALDFLEKEKNLSNKSLSRKLNSIHTFYKFLLEENLIDVDPSIKLQMPAVENKKQRVLSKQECLALKESARDNMRLYTIIQLLMQTGMRISEISQIKVKDFNFNKSELNLGDRKILLNKKCINVLKDYLENNKLSKDDFIFQTRNGGGIQIRNLRALIDRVFVKAKIKKATVNDLRNTFILVQLENGMPLKKIAEIVGHKSLIATERYLKLLKKKYKPGYVEIPVEV